MALALPFTGAFVSAFAWTFASAAPAGAAALEAHPVDALACASDETLATGSPDPAIFAREASKGIRAFWCETYDADGNARRSGDYRETYADGRLRTRARYVDSRIEGVVEVFDEAGVLWLRGELARGAWTGPLELFHPNGEHWLTAGFLDGRLDGAVETRFPDGQVESRTLFQNGREDGIATSYYPAAVGGGVRSQVRVEGDAIVERRSHESPASIGPNPVARLETAGGESASATPRVDASPSDPRIPAPSIRPPAPPSGPAPARRSD